MKHAIVYQPVDSPTAKYELFDTFEEANSVMQDINSAFNARVNGMTGGLKINDDVVTTPPHYIHLTELDLEAKKQEAADKKAAADQAAADDLKARQDAADAAEKNSNVLGGINDDEDKANDADTEDDAEDAPLDGTQTPPVADEKVGTQA